MSGPWEDDLLADKIVANEDPVRALKALRASGIFVMEPDFYRAMHSGEGMVVGKLNLQPPFYGGVGLLIDHTADIDIYGNCQFDDFVVIYTHSHDRDTVFQQPKKIDHSVRIGLRATILASCKSIGHDATIRAGSVVFDDVPDCEIWSGNPANKVE